MDAPLSNLHLNSDRSQVRVYLVGTIGLNEQVPLFQEMPLIALYRYLCSCVGQVLPSFLYCLSGKHISVTMKAFDIIQVFPAINITKGINTTLCITVFYATMFTCISMDDNIAHETYAAQLMCFTFYSNSFIIKV